MSEGSKMGLFGSKDRNQEQREKSSKDNSPARYAPYGIDSDTETYDTEALSMMDINDIIGVQSGEQVGDSTLESEIAALSQIITESKMESTSQLMDPKPGTQRDSSKASSATSDTVYVTNIDNIDISNADESSIMSGKCAISEICETQKATLGHTHKDVTCEKLSLIIAETSVSENIEMDSVVTSDKTSDVNINEIMGDTSVVCASESSSNDMSGIEIDSSTVTLDDALQETVQDKQQAASPKDHAASPKDHEKDIVEETEDQSVDEASESQKISKNNTKSVVTVGGFSKSLQLIGEAYNSEDSEEIDANDSDFSKETPSLSEETSLLGVSTIQQEDKIIEENSEVVDVSEQNTEKSPQLNDNASATISEKSKVDVTDSRTKNSNISIEKSEDSSQSELSQQTLKVQENMDESESNKAVKIDSGISSGMHESNDTEIDTANTMEEMSLECQSSNKTSQETINTLANTSTVSSMEIVNIEECQKMETKNIDSELNISVLTPETEKPDSLMISNEKELDTRKINDNFPLIDDDDVKDDVKDIKCKDKDILLEFASETQDSIITEVSDKKLSMTETMSKSDDLQEENTIIENCQTTQEITSITNKINDESQETAVIKMDLVSTTTASDNQDKVDLANAEETSVVNNKNTFQTASSIINEELVLNENTSLNHPHVEEKNITPNEQSLSGDLLGDKNSDLCSTNLITQSDTNSTNVNNSVETTICTEENLLALESLIPVKPDEPVKQLPSILEMPKVNDINDTVSNKLEDLPAPISHEDSSNTIENINKLLHEAEEIEDVEMKISEVVSTNKNQNETSPMENRPQQICDQPDSHIPDEENDSCANNSTMQIKEDAVTSSLCNTMQKEDKIEKNITIEISNKKKIRENEIFVPNLKEKDVIKPEKSTKAETHEMSLVLGSDISTSDAEATNSKDTNLQVDEEMKLCDKIANVPKKESKELIDVNVTPIVEEKSMEPIVEKSINANDVQSSIINIINMSLLQENSNAKTNIENLTGKLSQDSESVDAPTVTQTTNTLEGLLSLNLISDNESSTLKDMKTEDKTLIEETVSKNVDIDLLFDRVNEGETTMSENSDSITNVIASLTNRDNETSEADINAIANDKTTENEDSLSLRTNKDLNTESVNEITDEEKVKEPLEADSSLSQTDLDMDFEDNRLESVEDLEESEAKLELSQDILLENVMPRENLSRNVDTPIVIENSQSSSEISELESAVKFLQESEEQTIDSPLMLSPKMVESVVEDITKQANAELYASDEIDNYTNAESELANPNLRNVTAADSISISEAEIISEAAKLENERKFAAQIRNASDTEEKGAEEINQEIKPNEETENHTCSKTSSENVPSAHADSSLKVQVVESTHEEKNIIPDIRSLSSEGILKTCEMIPRVSILEERLKEPPKIEIPIPDSAKVLESSISPNDSLLIPKDARAITYSKMLESPKSIDKAELKGIDTPRKDLEKHSDPENVGSPRIILKIAKSAIADCSEPRSPKSPKIRSATNSPNPEDSPGQKLGKIKLKLSKGGHPSIISNENLEEINQWHTTDNAPSLSPLGMKIKLSKSGDASIVGSEKHEHPDETKYKIEEQKRTDSPIGMKIKLSKSGDASIISDSRQQDSAKEILTKHKEKLEIPQGSPKRTESPIGMKIKLSKSGDASIIQTDRQESLEEMHREIIPKRTDSPIGMKIKLSKTGDASIVSPDVCEDAKDSSTKVKEKQDNLELPKRTESPIGMKIKLTKCKGGASIISVDNTEDIKDKLEIPEPSKRTESPLGMKIKLSKTGDASIIHSEVTDDVKETRHKEKSEVAQDTMKTPESLGFKLKMLKTGEMTSSKLPDMIEEQDAPRSSESFTGVIPKIKVSKSGDTLADKTEPTDTTEDSRSQEDQAEVSKRTESPLGMKIKLSKSGDASIIQSETASEDHQKKSIPRVTDTEYSKGGDSSLGMKIKLFKTGDASVVEAPTSGSSEKKDKQQRRRDAADSPLEMKIKLSKTGHPTIVTCDNHGESFAHKGKDPQAALDPAALNFPHRYMEHATVHKESTLKILKTGHHPSILQGSRSELTIEPVQMQNRKQPTENVQQQIEISPKRKDITISPVESKKSKLEAQLSQILPEVTIQPVMCRDQKQQQQQLLFDPKSSLISRQQMNVINQEISITQVRPTAKAENTSSVNDKLKDLLCKNTTNSPGGSSDCEIIEHRPELIIVNENSNSSQDVVIIEEVTPNRTADIKVPKKRGRPRRNPIVAQQRVQQSSAQMLIPRDPLALDEVQQVPPQQLEHRENERPKRTCRNQKSYAPPKRGRGRGRGKRKLDNVEPQVGKKSRIDQDLSAIETSTMAVITIDEATPVQQDPLRKSSELYKALKQSPIDRKSSACKEKHIALTSRKETAKRDSFKASESEIAMQLDPARLSYVQEDPSRASTSQTSTIGSLDSKAGEQHKRNVLEIVSEKTQKAAMKQYVENKGVGKTSDAPSRASEIKEIPVPPPGHSNWLTPTSKKQADSTAIRGETVSTVQVIDEETRMSAESGSRSQTPARNIPAQASETIINEESQGSVLSTATTESEKVKVKNRRMEINFDPDEGPFTVDKIAEYEWPLDRKGETFMIQEQISQYLGVKSFKRKYPDLKRRVVDMEERNYLRENGLVSEAMCDMGLTAVCSSEVLDVMCSDFPDQYEEYRKHMREKQVKEHSKKQKELTAAANAERNRIDLAEMAVQSAFAWNSNFNKARKENRKCCLDLQTFTIHIPKKQQKVDSENKVGHYPVALIPGQYTDYYREYTPAELRYYPLNTVLYGPTRPNERKCDSQSEGSQSDSDSESSSDDSSSSSSEGTQDTEGSQSTMDDVDMEISNSKDDVKLKCKMCLKVLNKHNKNEILIQCGTCNGNVHPSCIDLTLDMVPHIQSYAWQCTDCKTCAQCHDPADEDKMLFCDMCDRGYHIYCVGLRRVPQGRWHCQECAVCANCGSREPGGANSDRNSVAQWQHEYKKGEKNTRVYVSTLCVPCSKLWRKGRYCPHCSRCHTAQRLDLEANLVHCSACDKYLHLECVETKGIVVDKKSYLCDFCTPSTRQQVTKPLVSKMLKT